MSTLTAYLFDVPDGPRDKAAHAIFREHQGHFVGAGTMLVEPRAGERDVEYDIPDEHRAACAGALKKAGFRLVPS